MDIYSQWFIALVAVLLFLVETLWPNHRSGFDKGWLLRAAFLALAGVSLETVFGDFLDPWLKQVHLFPTLSLGLSSWPAILSGLLGYYVVSFLVYWWHRLRHSSNFCWRAFHQIHHSPARIEVLTTFYGHPADFVANAAIISLVSFVFLGLSPLAAGWCLFWVGIFDTWEHTNVKTPVWLGYLIVRPEMHRVHHEYGKHAKNYGIPLWDMLFGTFENSSRNVMRCGFDENQELRLLEMLGAKDVHEN
ncbi:MAG: sterol desaturase family protein [Burkholderiales bacterium]|nr:sterol desaturase family protein [Burkholderiales bacterium]